MPFIIVTSYYPRGVFVLLNKIGYREILRKMVCIISKGSRICLSKHSHIFNKGQIVFAQSHNHNSKLHLFI